MSGLGISLLGTRINLPQTAERTQHFFNSAKAAEKLEGIDKHYQATSYLLMGMASSFFNCLSYGASALLESALIYPLDSEEAKNNFFEQGTHALNSLSFFAAGVFMTIGAIFAPDYVLEVILPPGQIVGPELEPTEVSVSVNGTKVELPESAKTTITYFDKAKAAENLEGFNKHYQATAYLLLGVAASFFNILAYGASAIFESALIAPIASERAKENFEEQGFNALNSIAYVAAGAIMTIGALFIPDQTLAQITVVNSHLPPPPPPRDPRDDQPNPVPPQLNPELVQQLAQILAAQGNLPQGDGLPPPQPPNFNQQQEEWMAQLLADGAEQQAALQQHAQFQEAFLMVQGTLGRFTREAIGEDVLQLMAGDFQALFGADGQRQPMEAELPAMKALLAQIIFYNDDEANLPHVLPHIQTELDQVKIHCAATKAQLLVQRQEAADLRAAQLLEDREILDEQRANEAAMRLKDEQTQVFAQEKAAWQALVDQAQGCHDELAAHVEALEVYDNAWRALKHRTRHGAINKRELAHFINQVERQVGIPGDVPAVNQAAVTAHERNAIAVQYADEDYSQLDTVEDERKVLHDQLDALGEQILELREHLPEDPEVRDKWVAIKAHLETLAEDGSLVNMDLLA